MRADADTSDKLEHRVLHTTSYCDLRPTLSLAIDVLPSMLDRVRAESRE